MIKHCDSLNKSDLDHLARGITIADYDYCTDSESDWLAQAPV